MYIYIYRWGQKHPPPRFLTGVEIWVGFGVGFSGLGTQILRFWGCRSLFLGFGSLFLVSEVPIPDSEMPVTFRRFWGHFPENAALFPPGKKTPFCPES